MLAIARALPSGLYRVADANFLYDASHPPCDDNPGKNSYDDPKPGVRENSV